jgi:hypothetical protein
MILTILAAAPLLLADDNGNRDFSVSFSNCREYVAFGPVSLAAAQALVPPAFTVSDIQGDGGIVVRTSACDTLSVEGSAPKPGIVAHVGINIASPDGTGDINNYTLLYVTTSEALAERLRRSGLPAVHTPKLAAEDPAVLPGEVYIAVFGDPIQPYFLNGTVDNPVGSPFPFLANWWYSGRFGKIRMSTNIPAIAFGTAGLVLHTSQSSPLGKLIGGNVDSNFPLYNVRGEFASAQMGVSTTR